MKNVIFLVILVALYGCGGPVFTTGLTEAAGASGEPDDGGMSTGGASGATGGRGMGGHLATTGGRVGSTGGSDATGGAAETGGATEDGGVPISTGGAPSTGGVAGTGGVVGSTGGASIGGAPATGGTSTGGAPATGGASSNTCPYNQKDCGAGCVLIAPITNGCDSSCTPCPLAPANGVEACDRSTNTCSFVCVSGFTRSGNWCI